MVGHLGDWLNFKIVTADRDTRDVAPYQNIEVDAWNDVGKAQVYYTSPGSRTVKDIARLICETPHDVLYINSFFDWAFAVQPLIVRKTGLAPRRPTIVAPRGEFSPGAFELKRWKKAPFTTLMRLCGVTSGVTWQASSEYEANDIRRVLGRSADQIVIAPNLPPPLEHNANDFGAVNEDRREGKLSICFLSRVTPKKNLAYALEVLREVSLPVEFIIYGSVSDSQYWVECQELLRQMPDHIDVQYHGAVDHERVVQTLARHDLFFFPTRGENYGHVVHEALSAGLPVLISDQTPWRRLTKKGIGWDIPLDRPDLFRTAIEEQVRLPLEARREQRVRAARYGRRISMDESIVAKNHALFLDSLAVS